MRKTKTEALKTREHLMLAALETFYQKGVSRSSLSEIAKNAGVTRGALYWHFKNKEDLFDAIFQRLCDEVACRLEEDLKNDTADMWESMHTSLNNTFRHLENDPVHYKFSVVLHLKCEYTEQNHAVTAIIGKYENMWYELLNSVLAQCVKQKSLPENLDITLAVIYLKSAITGIVHQWLLYPDLVNLKENGARFTEAILGSLRHCPSLKKLPDSV